MKVIRIHQIGDPGVLQLEDTEDPRPGAGEAVVQLEAVGLNFIEVYQRTGLYRSTLPSTPGGEGAGRVVEVGAGVTTVRPGDRVASTNFMGAYAGLARVPAAPLVPLPD